MVSPLGSCNHHSAYRYPYMKPDFEIMFPKSARYWDAWKLANKYDFDVDAWCHLVYENCHWILQVIFK